MTRLLFICAFMTIMLGCTAIADPLPQPECLLPIPSEYDKEHGPHGGAHPPCVYQAPDAGIVESDGGME